MSHESVENSAKVVCHAGVSRKCVQKMWQVLFLSINIRVSISGSWVSSCFQNGFWMFLGFSMDCLWFFNDYLDVRHFFEIQTYPKSPKNVDLYYKWMTLQLSSGPRFNLTNKKLFPKPYRLQPKTVFMVCFWCFQLIPVGGHLVSEAKTNGVLRSPCTSGFWPVPAALMIPWRQHRRFWLGFWMEKFVFFLAPEFEKKNMKNQESQTASIEILQKSKSWMVMARHQADFFFVPHYTACHLNVESFSEEQSDALFTSTAAPD